MNKLFSEDRIRRTLNQVERLGWHQRELARSSNTLDFQLSTQMVPDLYLSFSQNWVMTSTPLPDIKVEKGAYENLLYCNDQMHLLKFCLENGQICLASEWPMDHYGIFYLEDMLEAFETYLGGQGRRPHEMEPAVLWSTPMIEKFLAKLRHEKLYTVKQLDKYTWNLVYLGTYDKYSLFISFTYNWIYIQIPICHYFPSNKEIHAAMMLFLMELNLDTHWGKFFLHPGLVQNETANLVGFSVEIPAKIFSTALLNEAANTLITYTERYHHEIGLIALEPELGRLILGEPPDPTWFERKSSKSWIEKE